MWKVVEREMVLQVVSYRVRKRGRALRKDSPDPEVIKKCAKRGKAAEKMR